MIADPEFPVEPWAVRETELRLEQLAQAESVLALSNGHVGLRGNLDEGEPAGLPGTYLNGFYELRPLPYAEAGYGNPESGQTVLNVTNGKLIRLLVDDEPLDVRYGELRRHERVLDLRDGVLRRTAEWVSPTGRAVRVSSTRLVSFTQRAIVAICYEVEPLDGTMRLVVQSELVANESLPDASADPRAAAALREPLLSEMFEHRAEIGVLVHLTRGSGLRVAAAMHHLVQAPDGYTTSSDSFEDLVRFIVTADVQSGERIRVVKLVAYGWSEHRSVSAVRDQVSAALAEAQQTTWAGLLSEQRAYLDDFWERTDVEIDGDPELQQAVRFAMFHTLQAGARAEGRAIPAKGLTGSGYDGHTFWDTEMFVLPLLSYTLPQAVRDALRFRHRTLPEARERARQLGLGGAAFPWRTIAGQECSGYWPAGTAAFHNAAAIADAVVRYRYATDDGEFAAAEGFELLVETARLYRSLGHFNAQGEFRIDGVTGPDEYTAVQDNNTYTNLMVERNLREAADAVTRWPERASELGVSDAEAGGWREAAAAMLVPYDEQLGIHPQTELFARHDIWDFDHTSTEDYPLLLHFPYFDLYRKRVVKQADLVLALHHRGDMFTLEQKARNFAYYEPLTVRDSSLSACTQAVIAAECGHLELAYDYLAEAALIDLDDLQHNTRDGLHIASLAGAWIGVVHGFGGLRDHDGVLSFAPRLPPGIPRFAFRLTVRDSRLRVEVRAAGATYSVSGGPLDLVHHGQALTVVPDAPQTLEIPPPPQFPEPSQPPGRAPIRRALR